jgi:Tfp pilus assembly protein PilN
MTWMNIRVNASGQRVWVGGFNLLPYRQRDARRARRRCVAGWLVAALGAAVGVLALAGWQIGERMHFDALRRVAEHELAGMQAPMAEHARLARELQLRHQRDVQAEALSVPLVHALALLDALAQVSVEGVVLQQIRQRAHDTELLAMSTRPAAPALWLKQLSAVHGVARAEVIDLHPVARVDTPPLAGGPGLMEFAARLHWEKAAEATARPDDARRAMVQKASVAEPRARHEHMPARATRPYGGTQ